MVFIGWFLRNAAISSYQQHLLLTVLSGVRARQAMTPDPDTVPADATVRELADEYFMRRRHASYPVVDPGSTVGLVTLHAVREVPRAEWDTRTAREIMIPIGDEIVVRSDDDMVAVMERMTGSPARRVLVMRDGALLGIITPSDITFWLERARQEGEGR
jgi:CBS domain-containing protein